MSALHPCHECGGREVWVVERVVERGSAAWRALGKLDGLAPMSIGVCVACNNVEWHATPDVHRDERVTLSRRIVDERLSCRDCCGRPHLLVAMLLEETTGRDLPVLPLNVVRRAFGDAAGRFALVVCEACGRAEWFACEVAATDGSPCEGACRRCEARALRRVRPFREENGDALPVAVVRGIPRGELELRWCVECGACDWRAHGVAKLAAERKQIVDARERVPVAGGPYR